MAVDNDIRQLRNNVRDLIHGYDEGHAHGPGLLHQIESVEAHLTTPQWHDHKRHRTKLDGRPPIRIDLIDLAHTIRTGATEYATRLGANTHDPIESLTRIPNLTSALPPQIPLRRHICITISHWHNTCRLALTYIEPAIHYPQVTCPHCSSESLRVRPTIGRVWCTTPGCTTPDGNVPTWERDQLWAYVVDRP